MFIPFQEYALSHCDVTCLEHMSPLLFAGTTSGSVIIWNLETEKIALRYSNYVYNIYELQGESIVIIVLVAFFDFQNALDIKEF